MKTVELKYYEKNGYLYPDLALPEQAETTIGKYGLMWLDFLKKHRRGIYTTLLTDGTLAEYLARTDAEAREEIGAILARLAKERGITEALKAAEPMRWVQEMNAAKHDAEETVCREN